MEGKLIEDFFLKLRKVEGWKES